MMDAEMAFVEHDDNLQIQEGLVRYIINYCLKNCFQELSILERDIEKLKKANAPFLRLTYDEAIEKLNELGSDIKYGEDLGNDDEGLLTKNSNVPIFIHKWPKSIKPFYMKRDPGNPDLVLNDDLIATDNGGEIIGGSQREDNYDLLLEKITAEGLNLEDYKWYLDLRRFGGVKHAGFGLGFERAVMYLTGMANIRDVIPFPRTPKNADF